MLIQKWEATNILKLKQLNVKKHLKTIKLKIVVYPTKICTFTYTNICIFPHIEKVVYSYYTKSCIFFI